MCFELENLSSHIDMHIHADSVSNNQVTLSFAPLTSRSIHAERLPRTVCLLSLVLTAQAVLL